MKSVIPVADNILVVGEAAGLVNPLNGEGIGTAMFSGELAAQHAKVALEKGDFSCTQLRHYAQELQRQIGRNHLVATILRRLLGYAGIMNYAIWQAKRNNDFAQTLFEVILEVKPAAAVLTPKFIAKFLAG